MKRIIVIGAGFAGITAAREVALRGFNPVVLEARDRVGGRTWSVRRGSRVLELGGTWVHWWQPHVFAELQRYGLELSASQTPAAAVWLAEDRRYTGTFDEVLSGLGRAADRFWHGLSASDLVHSVDWPGADDADATAVVADRLAATPLNAEQRALVEALLSTCASGPPERTSLRTMLRWWTLAGSSIDGLFATTGTYKIRSGTGALIRAMMCDGNLDVRLNTRVVTVVRDGGEVRVLTHSGEEIAGSAVISTPPINALEAISFQPALSSVKVEALDNRHTGGGFKAILRVRGVGEPSIGFAGAGHLISNIQTEYTEGADEQLMVAFGPEAGTDGLPSEQMLASAVRDYFPGATVVDVIGHPWTADEPSQGTWTVLPPSRSELVARLMQSEGRLIFAGDATSPGWNGFIDGAIASGLRAAREAAELLTV